MDISTIKGQLLSDFFAYYPMGGALYDSEGALLELNKAMSEKFSVTDKADFLLNNLFETEFLSEIQKEHLRHSSVVSGTLPIGFSIIPASGKEGERVGYTLLLTDVLSPNATQYDREIRDMEYMTQKVVEAVPDTILLVNKKLVVERIIAFATETCITPEAMNRRVDDLPGFIYPDETKRKMVAVVTKCLNGSEIVNLNLSIPGHDVPIVYFQIRMVPIQNKYVVIYIRNVSDLVEKENENKNLTGQLSESRTMMELTLRNSKVTTYSFCFDRFNSCDRIHCQHCFQFYGTNNTLLEKNKYICRALSVLSHSEDQYDFFFLFNEMRNNKLHEYCTDFRLKNNEGEYRHYDVVGKTQSFDSEGYPNMILGCIIDNQERVEYEMSLIKAREKAEKADQLKSAFLANMTHEIRTPLNAIVGFSDLLSTEEDPELRESYANLIKTNNELLLRLVNDVLDISKIESDMVEFSYMDVHLPSVMRDLYNMMKLRMPESISFTLDPCADLLFNTDKNRFVQIMANLLINAVKYTQEGTIHFGYQLMPTEIRFYVSDTGSGIPENELENIFTRFVQLKNFKQGIGLGLPICKGLITTMGGRIFVESKVGVGSTFSFVLPLDRKE